MKPFAIVIMIIALAVARGQEIEIPHSPSGTVALFAREPLIRHPIGIEFDRHGRLLAVESHTHFRPKDYVGPEGDRIVWLRDTDGNDEADDKVVLLEGLQHACILKQHANGWLYVTTRNEVLRLRDDDGDGMPEEVDRRIVWLETEGNHPHNGISGIDFDSMGNVIFGMGENLGSPYTLQGRDGAEISDVGEGGNIFKMDAEGKGLVRYATGFWNPFGICVDEGGRIYATDNDPSGSPPCRLHYILEGGDYGYLYRYGRSGKHPFVAWNGELPGTIPMLAAVGEAPCDLVSRSFDDGTDLFVTSWVDHRVEVIRRRPGNHVQRWIAMQGGAECRPVGVAWAPDGSLFVSDWVSRSYKLHGLGRIWKVSGKIEPADLVDLPTPNWERALNELGGIGDFRLYEKSAFDKSVSFEKWSEAEDLTRIYALLGWSRERREDARVILPKALVDPEPEIRLLALKWIADQQLLEFREQVEAVANAESDPDLFYGAITALARIDGADVFNDKALADLLRGRIFDEEAAPQTRLAALRIFPRAEEALKAKQLAPLLQTKFVPLRGHVIRLLTQLNDPDKVAILEQIIDDETVAPNLREFALVGLPERELPQPALGFLAPKRPTGPPAEPVVEWFETILANPPNLERGRLAFYHPKLGGCSICHRIDGIGRTGGPDLSMIGERPLDHIVRSIVDPAAEVAPQFLPWSIQTTDGEQLLAFQLRESGGNHWYSDIGGSIIPLKIEQIAHREQVSGSLMPPGLDQRLSDAQLRDLVAFLQSLRSE